MVNLIFEKNQCASELTEGLKIWMGGANINFMGINLPSLVGIGLTDLPKSGTGGNAPFAPKVPPALFNSVKSLSIHTTGNSANLATLFPTPFQFVQCVALVWPLSGPLGLSTSKCTPK